MKSPFVFLLSLLGASICAMAAPAPLSSEARTSFEWFDTLGFPDLKNAVWAEIRRANAEGAVTTPSRLTFVLQQRDETLTILDAYLCPVERPRRETATSPRYDELNFVACPFDQFCRSYLSSLASAPQSPPKIRFGTELTPKSEAFYLAHACWRRGDAVMAQSLYAAAGLIRDNRAQPAKSMREYLEREFVELAMWQAFLLAGGIDEYVPSRTALPSRQEVLAAFQRASQFPNSPHAPRAAKLATLLKEMIAEDATHDFVKDDVLATKSVEDQVQEYIFRLRNQNGYQIVQPGTCDIFIGKNWPSLKPNDSPADRLVKIGRPAVPMLIEALADKRPTRSVNFSRTSWFSHRMLTVGDCAAIILSKIAGQNFRFHHPDHLEELPPGEYDRVRHAVQSWWEKSQ
ncbi:hypothetical protein [Verrucomicrobium sp. BvORR106]|uniref:hypothetical protein n=1 Tax=Verrucomicrobium sp. BvORR106 TaxID=1403819 RepID=UPI000B1A3E74|nr:hypothetical protein [Verrucomicrobium sp. BvORR106]